MYLVGLIFEDYAPRLDSSDASDGNKNNRSLLELADKGEPFTRNSKSCASVVPRKFVAGFVLALPVSEQSVPDDPAVTHAKVIVVSFNPAPLLLTTDNT